jgi:predicted AAA+ superfamily ATPase
VSDSPAGRVAYADLTDHPLIAALDGVRRAPGDSHARQRADEALFALTAPKAQAVADLVLSSRGAFAMLARAGIAVGAARRARAAAELADLAKLAHMSPGNDTDDDGSSRGGSDDPHPPAFRELRARMADRPDWENLVNDLTDFHRAHGVAPIARYRSLRVSGGALVGVVRPDRMTVDDLVGGDATRAPLVRALDGFLAGNPSNDALLYGPPGTGKSATVRALAHGAADRGLRLVQVDRAELAHLPAIFDQLAGDGPPVLVLLDDIVFDEGDRADRGLRAALEGDAVERPANVTVWATSNRLKILRETLSERDDDIEAAGGRGERAALATRFGLRVAMQPLDADGYLDVALTLLERRLGHRPPDASAQALRFARAGHGLTPRVARQFAAVYTDGQVASAR